MQSNKEVRYLYEGNAIDDIVLSSAGSLQPDPFSAKV
jgi:hypothetical protein